MEGVCVHGYTRSEIQEAVVAAFRAVHNGRSTDDVVIDERLNRQFLAAASQLVPGVADRDLNWYLFNLRKTGKLGPVTSQSKRLRNQEEYIHASEIAARVMEDKYGATIDRLLCDPRLRSEFDHLASSVAPGRTPYEYRKAALKLRKAGRLRPELLKRVMQSGTHTALIPAGQLLANPDLLPRLPGIYMIADDTGPLYIGESSDLRSRVIKHLDHSDNKSLAHYLWAQGIKRIKVETIAFDKSSLGAKSSNRKALEASLIASRQPRFNIQHALRRLG